MSYFKVLRHLPKGVGAYAPGDIIELDNIVRARQLVEQRYLLPSEEGPKRPRGRPPKEKEAEPIMEEHAVEAEQ